MLSIICFCLFLGNIEKIAKINSIIIPFLIIFILFVGVKNLLNININQIGLNTTIDKSFFGLIQACIYASYNLILLIPVLINLRKFINNRKQICLISVLTGIIINIISILIFLLLINVDDDFSKIEMPIIYVVKNKFGKISMVYGFIILTAIFTTAVSAGISFLNNICKNKKSFPHIAFIMCIISVIISNIGFSNLVKILFPMFGYLGVVQIFFITRTKK